MLPECSVCGDTTKELRPYGKNGADVCFDCMMETPEREQEAKRRFGGLLAKNDRELKLTALRADLGTSARHAVWRTTWRSCAGVCWTSERLRGRGDEEAQKRTR